MGQCTVLYKPPQDAAETGRQIIDDVLTVQAAVGSLCTSRTEAEQALIRIQRRARALLQVEAASDLGADDQPIDWLDGLVDLVTKLEQGQQVRHNVLRQTLVTLEVASAKIKRYLEAGNGVARSAA
jgi:hypothetical protein